MGEGRGRERREREGRGGDGRGGDLTCAVLTFPLKKPCRVGELKTTPPFNFASSN